MANTVGVNVCKINPKMYASTLKYCVANKKSEIFHRLQPNFADSISTIVCDEYEDVNLDEIYHQIKCNSRNDENDKVKEIVSNLVMSKYGGGFEKTLKRMSFRKSGRRSNSSGIFSNSSNASCSYSDSDEASSLLSSKCDEKSEGYSVNTTNLSNLLSTYYKRDFIKPDCLDEDYYYNIDDFVQEVSEKLDVSIGANEKDTDKSRFVQFREDIFRLSTQIDQILKTIDLIKDPHFDNQRLEAEVALLTALHRLDMLRSSFLSPSTLPQNELPVSTVTINNIAILTSIPKMDGFDQYFIGIFSCGRDLIKTELIKKSGQGNYLNIRGPWIFDKVIADFKINLKIYCLNVEKKKTVFRKCFQKKPNFTCYRRAFQMAPSMFEFVGQIDITKPTLGCNNIRPLYRSPFGYAQSWISVDSTACLNIEMNQSGFLDVAKVSSNSCPLWSRRWCTLDDTRLMFWNYPREQDFHHDPFDIIDLKNCRNFRVATREECCRNRTLILDIDSNNNNNGNSTYFLSIDSQEEFEEWKNCLSVLMEMLEYWRQFETYPERVV